MGAGIAISRQWVLVLQDGTVVVDWGDQLFQDLVTGEFTTSINSVGAHVIQDDELAWLERTGKIFGFSSTEVNVPNLPERFNPPMD